MSRRRRVNAWPERKVGRSSRLERGYGLKFFATLLSSILHLAPPCRSCLEALSYRTNRRFKVRLYSNYSLSLLRSPCSSS